MDKKRENNQRINKVLTIFPVENLDGYILTKLRAGSKRVSLSVVHEKAEGLIKKANDILSQEGRSSCDSINSFDNDIPYINNVVNIGSLENLSKNDIDKLGIEVRIMDDSWSMESCRQNSSFKKAPKIKFSSMQCRAAEIKKYNNQSMLNGLKEEKNKKNKGEEEL